VFEVGGWRVELNTAGRESCPEGARRVHRFASTNLRDEHGPLIELIRRDAPLVLVDRQLPATRRSVCTTARWG